MRPLTDTVAKPLLVAGGQRLIEWQLAALARAGVHEAVINLAHLPDQFVRTLGTERSGVTIHYSREGERADEALETLGGIVRALPQLGEAPFIVVSGDIVTDFDYSRLGASAAAINDGRADAHLVLVDNPPFHVDGDMGLVDGRVAPDLPRKLTYANIGIFAPRLFAGLAPARARLFPWLYGAARAGRVSGEHFRGRWYNIGTSDELQRVDRELLTRPLHAEPF